MMKETFLGERTGKVLEKILLTECPKYYLPNGIVNTLGTDEDLYRGTDFRICKERFDITVSDRKPHGEYYGDTHIFPVLFAEDFSYNIVLGKRFSNNGWEIFPTDPESMYHGVTLLRFDFPIPKGRVPATWISNNKLSIQHSFWEVFISERFRGKIHEVNLVEKPKLKAWREKYGERRVFREHKQNEASFYSCSTRENLDIISRWRENHPSM